MEDSVYDLNGPKDLMHLCEKDSCSSSGRQLERRQIRGFLEWLNKEENLIFPVRVVQREQPDFELQWPQARIGIEVTMITTTALEAAKRLERDPTKSRQLNLTAAAGVLKRGKVDKDWLKDVTVVSSPLNSQFSSPGGIAPNEELENFLNVAVERIRDKIQKSSKYTALRSMWLILQDQLSVIPLYIDPERIEILKKRLPDSVLPFTRIFILSEDFSSVYRLV